MHDLGLRTPEDILGDFMHYQHVDLERIEGEGTRCGSCHQSIVAKKGVTFGRPSLHIPAINVCASCVQIALAVIAMGNRKGKGKDK